MAYNPDGGGVAQVTAATGLLSSGGVTPAITVDPGATIQVSGLDTSAPAVLALATTNATGTSLGPGVPAQQGTLRFPNGAIVFARDVQNASDRVIWQVDSSNQLYIGTDGGFTKTRWGGMRLASEAPIIIGTSVYQNVSVNSGSLGSLNPILGSLSPYGVHGKIAVATAAPFILSAAASIYEHVRLTDDTTGTVTFLQPASDVGAYTKFVGNASATGTKTISTGAGATVVLLPLTGATIGFDNTIGCILKSSALAYA